MSNERERVYYYQHDPWCDETWFDEEDPSYRVEKCPDCGGFFTLPSNIGVKYSTV